MRQSWQRKTLHKSNPTSSNILKTLLQYLYFIIIQMLLEINYLCPPPYKKTSYAVCCTCKCGYICAQK